MGFDRDVCSPLADLFLALRDILLNSIPDVHEAYSENQTSYKTRLGMYCCIRVVGDYVNITWGRGALINDKYKELFGNGTVVKKQKVTQLDEKTIEMIKYYIDETTIVLIEHNELMKMRKTMKNFE